MATLAGAFRCAAVSVALGSCLSLSAWAQSAARVEGRALDAQGVPLRNAVVRFIADTRSHASPHPWRYTLLADSLGKFSQGGLAPGAYLVMVYSGTKAESVWRTISLVSNATTRLDLQPSSRSDETWGKPQTSTIRVSSRTSARVR